VSYHQNIFEWGVCDICKEWTPRVVWLRVSCCSDCWGDIRLERENWRQGRGEGDRRAVLAKSVPVEPLPSPDPIQLEIFE